jgi:hypothetical protein
MFVLYRMPAPHCCIVEEDASPEPVARPLSVKVKPEVIVVEDCDATPVVCVEKKKLELIKED